MFVDVLRAIATIIITNSHFSPIYMSSTFAKGGAFGNSLFFLISGFCLFNIDEPFKKWYPKRLLRLYIPFLLFTCFNLYIGKSFWESAFFSIIFPAQYWFICALIIMYPIYYFVITHPYKYRKCICLVILIFLYSTFYLFLDKTRYVVETAGFYGIRFSYFFSFFLMLSGGYIRENYSIVLSYVKNRTIQVTALFLGSLWLYFLFILSMNKFTFLYKVQFIETILCFSTTFTLMLSILSLEPFLKKTQTTVIMRTIRYLSSCTLEIYLVQFPIINWVGKLILPTGIKFFIAVTTILLRAFVLKLSSRFVNQELLSKAIKKTR